ncbi:hypothetical protein EV644_110111 [Kribbella orskensis]|uniref:Uncharacterized protein n=1 Tax=Kribbella orskensis TaxID=2512216 RepID=A0ABY2BJG0_9ACTN|nr:MULTISPECIES: hypothetical protein [Kribbella]TCN37977.1 hypothetical protein EV642_110134 [Kribbella sp. VKM Ac-2500]TCO19463.1 hypothetical protein EV644_110111 [Kribbella orskensis]
MRNRVGRGLIALSAVFALLMAVPASTAMAADGETTQVGNRSCSMYVNSTGFGAYCSSGHEYAGTGVPIPTWRQRLNGNIFIPCRDFPVPAGIELPAPPEGKTWVLRLTLVDYNLNRNDGGDNVHIEQTIVPVSEAEQEQCPNKGYMDVFWRKFNNTYPAPALQVKPTYTPRVNVPAYFSLTRDSSFMQRNEIGNNPYSAYWYGNRNLTMRAMVSRMTVDPGDGTPPFTCLMGTGRADADYDGYDETADPFHQMSTCKHKYTRSSANQPDGMYTVKLTITWEVSYWVGPPRWQTLGEADVHAVQRLPVQEVQAIGG